ncbi:Putative aminoacrylate hydrolase RutD [uncultured archaeon]|nr:Putative aminoacrylate hydrolase RutD [uncultured archaeon]
MGPFSKCYHTIAISRRYHYPNDFNDGVWDYSAINHAEDLATFIQDLGLEPAHIVGHSYGAYACAILTVRHPELIRTLVLCEPPIIPLLCAVPGGESIVSDFMDKIWNPVEEAFKKGDLNQGVRIFIDGISGDGTFDKLPSTVREIIMSNAQAMKAQAMARDQFPVFTCHDAQRIEAPAFLVSGEKSHKMLHSVLKELKRCLANSQTTVIPDASHNMHVANPQAFNVAVLDFLARN